MNWDELRPLALPLLPLKKTKHDRERLALLERFPDAGAGRSFRELQCTCPACETERTGGPATEPVPPTNVMARGRKNDDANEWRFPDAPPDAPRIASVRAEIAKLKEELRMEVEKSKVRPKVQGPSEPPVRLRPERQFE